MLPNLFKNFFFVSLVNVLQSKRASKDNNFVSKACANLLNINWISNFSLFQTKIGKEDILQCSSPLEPISHCGVHRNF